MKESAEVLFKLLRIALGNELEYSLPLSVDWKEVIDMSFEQGVAALAEDGLQHIYDLNLDLNLDLDKPELEDLKYEWFGEVMNCEQDYASYAEALRSLCALAGSQGIELLLMKGYGLSLNYPIPSHRPCGDIDVRPVGEGRWQQLNELAAKTATVEETTEKHSAFEWQGFTVENHRRLLDGFIFKAEEAAERILEPAGVEALAPGEGYWTLDAGRNWFYLVCHIAQHFLADGEMSLRQLLDLALHLDRHREEIDVEQCRQWMKATGYGRINDIMVALSADVTGLDLSAFVFEAPSVRDKERVMDVVLSRDRKLSFPSGRIARIGYKLRKMFSGSWKYRYVPMTFRERFRHSLRLHLERPELV